MMKYSIDMDGKGTIGKSLCFLTRRNFLKALGAGSAAISAGIFFGRLNFTIENKAESFIASVSDYGIDLSQQIIRGLKELGVKPFDVKDKKILLKPNLVEPYRHLEHINTHPLVVRGAVEAFLILGASEVLVAEGSGHRRDSLLVLEESGLADVLFEDKIRFIDLNDSSVIKVKNQGNTSRLSDLYFPEEILKADLIVSIAKMKTHHWAGVTLSMKNLFGVMPGIVYGWPKNVLHWAGLQECIFDITATLKPHLAIVDGIVGMEGDGPIMGTPVQSNVIVIGKNFPAVDATCARIMGIDPEKISYLKHSSGRIGSIKESSIDQRGENIQAVRTNYKLLDYIPAQKHIRLGV
jgi:uncharacterized protein (DUF362 family)